MGLIHLYFGNGKGKTTAATGLAVRAAGAGKKVVIVQFLKGTETCENNIMKLINNITVIREDFDYGFDYSKKTDEITEINNMLIDKALSLVYSNDCDMLILDEVTYPYDYNLINREKIDLLLRQRPRDIELIITGRNPAPIMMECADYISEIREIRHPYSRGIKAREGIEF